MTIIGFPAPPPETAKTLKDWPWDTELGKPFTSINEGEQLVQSPAAKILQKASGLIDGERNLQHGDRKECHTLIARMWTAFLGVKITPTEVACMMALLKIARTRSGSYNGDSYVDAAGYAALAGELADAGC